MDGVMSSGLVSLWDGQDNLLCTVEPDVNVKKCFGAHAFLVDRATRSLVDMSDSGLPRSPLSSRAGYVLLSSLSHSLVEGRQVHGDPNISEATQMHSPF